MCKFFEWFRTKLISLKFINSEKATNFPEISTVDLSYLVKFMFSKKATKIDEIFTVDLTLTTQRQIEGEDFVKFCGLLKKHEL